MGKIAKSLLSIVGLGKAPKAAAPAPVAAPVQEIKDDQGMTAKKARQQLYATEGGVQGQELDPAQVKKRQTLLGN